MYSGEADVAAAVVVCTRISTEAVISHMSRSLSTALIRCTRPSRCLQAETATGNLIYQIPISAAEEAEGASNPKRAGVDEVEAMASTPTQAATCCKPSKARTTVALTRNETCGPRSSSPE